MVGVTFDAATTSLASACITQAENKIREYLSKRYDTSGWTTSASTPPLVTTLCEWYSSGLLWKYNSRGGKESISRGDNLIAMAEKNLSQIANYEHDLIDSSGDVIADMSNTAYRILSTTNTYTETFAEDDELLWSVDDDKLDDIDSDRD